MQSNAMYAKLRMGSSSLCCRPFKAGSKSGVKTVLSCLRQARVSSVRVAAFLDEDHPRTSDNPRKVEDKLSISEQVGAETVTVTTRARPPSIARDDAIESHDLSSSNGHSSCSDTDGYLADSEDSTPSINNASSSSSASSNIDFSESNRFPTAHQSSRTRAALRPGPLGRFAYPPSSVRTRQAPLTLEMLPDLNKEGRERVDGFVEQLLASGMDSKRAQAILDQWSEGRGISNIDIRRLRDHFKRATLTRPVASELLPAAAVDLSMTTLAWINLTQVPMDLPFWLRMTLIAVDLLMLIGFASNAVRSTDRLVSTTSAALRFAQDADKVLAALASIASSSGALRHSVRSAARSATPAANDVDPDVLLSSLDLMMRYAKAHARQPAHATSSTSNTQPSKSSSGSNATSAGAHTSHVESFSPHAVIVGDSVGDSKDVGCITTADASSSSSSNRPVLGSAGALASLDSFLVRQQAALYSQFDPVRDMGMTVEDAADAAAAFAKYARSQRKGMPAVGLYEFKQLMSQACSMPLSTAELELALRTCSTGGNAAMTFEDWCRWWSRTLSSLKQTRCDAITSARDRWEAEGVDRIDI